MAHQLHHHLMDHRGAETDIVQGINARASTQVSAKQNL